MSRGGGQGAAVYSRVGRPCPPGFAFGYAGRGPASVISPNYLEISAISCWARLSRGERSSLRCDRDRAERGPRRDSRCPLPAKWGRRRSVLHLDLGVPDHRAPFVDFRFQERGELGRRRAFRGGAEVVEAGLDRRVRQRGVGVGVELGDDLRRRLRPARRSRTSSRRRSRARRLPRSSAYPARRRRAPWSSPRARARRLP